MRGYLVRKQGKGTFVAPRHVENTEASPVKFFVFISRHVAGMSGGGREVQLRILRGVQDALGDAYSGSGVRQAASGFIDDDTRRFVESRQPGAALIIEPSFCPDLPKFLVEHGWNVWAVNEPHANLNCVRIDQEHAGYLATRYLIVQKRKKIALLNGPTKSYWGFEARKQGYVRALNEAGMKIDKNRHAGKDAHPIDSEAGRVMMRSLLDRNN